MTSQLSMLLGAASESEDMVNVCLIRDGAKFCSTVALYERAGLDTPGIK